MLALYNYFVTLVTILELGETIITIKEGENAFI